MDGQARIGTLAAVTAVTLVMLAGCSSSKQSAVEPAASSPTTPRREAPVAPGTQTSAATPGRTPAPAVAPDAVNRSALRERALAILEEMALSTTPLLRANALEGLHPTPARAEAAARAGLADDNLGVRFTAAMTVGKLKLTNLSDKVRPLLGDPSPTVRGAAIFALYRTGQKVDQSPLSRLLNDPDPRTRAQGAFILGEMGNPSAIPMLREAARNEQGEAAAVRLFKLQVAEALVKLGDDTSANVLDAALYPKLPEEFEAAVLAAQIIGEVRSERAIWQLVNLIETRINAGSAVSPTSSVETITDAKARGATAAGAATGGGQTPAAMGGAFLYPKELRLAAATALARMGHLGGVYVADELRTDSEAIIRAQAAFLYGATRQAQFLRPLEEMLEDPSALVRVAAASAIIRVLDGKR